MAGGPLTLPGLISRGRRWPLGRAVWHQHLLLLAYLGLIFALSSITVGTEPTGDPLEAALAWVAPGVQNVLHVPMYFGLCMLWCRSLSWARLAPIWRVSLAAGLAVVYGAVDEAHQLYVPGRYASYTDVALNAFGALGAAWWIGARGSVSGRAVRGSPGDSESPGR
jgi:VanZ family protein